MAQRVRGPHDIQFGNDTITDVEEVEVDYSQDNEEYDTVQGNKYTYDTTSMITVTLTLLANDVDALRVFLPDRFVANGGTLSTGETVSDADGAIDIEPSGCPIQVDERHLIITSCADPNQVLRIPDCSARIDGIELDGAGARKVMISLRGEGTTVAQFFGEGAVDTIS